MASYINIFLLGVEIEKPEKVVEYEGKEVITVARSRMGNKYFIGVQLLTNYGDLTVEDLMESAKIDLSNFKKYVSEYKIKKNNFSIYILPYNYYDIYKYDKESKLLELKN